MKIELPQDAATERAILGAAILDSETYFSHIIELKPEYFTLPGHRIIFAAITEHYKVHIDLDPIALGGYLKLHGQLELIGGYPAILGLVEDITSIAVVKHHINNLIETYHKREMLMVALDVISSLDSGNKTPAEARDYVENRYNEIFSPTSDQRTKDDYTTEFWTDLNILKDRGGIEGPAWFLKELNDITGGVLPGYWVLGGLKKSCKTIVACQQLQTNIRNGIPTLYISLEPTPREIFTHLITQRNPDVFENTDFSRAFMLKQGKRMEIIHAELSNFKNECFDIDYKFAATYDSIISTIRKGFIVGGYKFFIIDYLQQIDPGFDRGHGRATQIAIGVNKLAQAIRELGCQVLALSQLSNVAENEPEPHVAHLKESGGIAEAAQGVLLINNYKRLKMKSGKVTERASEGQVDIIVPAVRRGESPRVVECFGDLCHSRLLPLDTKHREDAVSSADIRKGPSGVAEY